MKIILLLGLLYLTAVYAKQLKPENVIVAINAGSPEQLQGS